MAGHGASIVALLFTDLVGSTAMYDALGDDTAEALRRQHFHLLREAIGDRGTEVKNVGDGLMVVFPSVVAAVDSAVRMQQLVARQRGPEHDLHVRIGVNVGEPIQDDADYFGVSVALARRLCDAAGAGQIFVSDVVQALTRPRGTHQLRSLGRLTLKGLAEPVEAFEVLWERPADIPMPFPTLLASARTTPLVGRHDEQASLEESCDPREPSARLVLLRGEPGVGKTRLAAEVGFRLHERGAAVLFGRCGEEPLIAYQPFVEAVAHYARHTPATMLASELATLSADVARVVPVVADRLGGDTRAPVEVDRGRLFEGLTRLLDGAAARSGAIVVIDDLHWADEGTLALLRHVLRTAGSRLVLLATYRDSDVTRTHPLADALAAWRREGDPSRTTLRGLDDEAIRELLFPGNTDAAVASLAAAITAETEGNPFFAKEIGRHLADTGALVGAGGALRSTVALDTIGLPEGVRDVIGRRLSRLTAETNAVLSTAAVIGRSFRLEHLAGVVGEATEAVLAHLEAAMAAHLVAEVHGEVDRFEFTHALVRQTLYEETATSRRVRVHQRAAEALAGTGAPAAEVAHHLLEAVPAAKAEDAGAWALRAAEAALYEGASYEEAVTLTERALAVVSEPPELRADLLLTQCEAVGALGDAERTMELAEEAAGVAMTIGDTSRLGQAAIFTARSPATASYDERVVALLDEALGQPGLDPVDEARLLGTRALRSQTADELTERSARAVAAAEATQDLEALLYATLTQVDVLMAEPLVDEAVSLLAVFDQPLPPRLRGGHMAAGLRTIGLTYRSGDRVAFAMAVDAFDEAVTRHPIVPWTSTRLMVRAMEAIVDGEVARAEQLGLEAMTETTIPVMVLQASAILWQVARERGRSAEVGAALEAVSGSLEAELSPVIAALVANLAAVAGDIDRARTVLPEIAPERDFSGRFRAMGYGLFAEAAALCDDQHAVQVAEAALRPWSGLVMGTLGVPLAPADHYLGMLAAAGDRHEEAVARFEAAIETADILRSPLWRAHTQVEHARVLLRRGRSGDRPRAEALLEAARSSAASLGLERVLNRAQV